MSRKFFRHAPRGLFLLTLINVAVFTLFAKATLFADPLRGFQINRYEPLSPGEWGVVVDHPWYSSTRYIAADATFEYANRPLVFGDPNRWSFVEAAGPIAIEHQIMGRINVAGSFLDRVQISGSLPIAFWESGTSAGGVTPIGSPNFGDPRLGLMVRLVGQPYHDPISLSVGGFSYIPLRKWASSIPEQLSDEGIRFTGKLVLAGILRNQGSPHAVVWSVLGAFAYRAESLIGNLPLAIDNSTGAQTQIGFSFGYGQMREKFHIGLEALLSSDVLRSRAFQLGSMSLDLYIGTHVPLGRLFQLHLAGGVGLLHQSATADARFIAQVAFAPWDKEKEALPVSLPQLQPSQLGSPPIIQGEASPAIGL